MKETRLLEQHTEMGESGRPWVFLLFVGLLAVMLLGIWLRRRAAANGGTLAIVPTARGTCFRMTIPRPADTSEAPSVAKPVTSTKPLASPAHS